MKTNKRFYGGSGSSSGPAPAPAYNPASDPGYQSGAALIASLLPQMTAANTKMTPAQILASLPAIQQQLIASQATPSAAPNSSAWGNINNKSSAPSAPSVNPSYAPIAQNSLYNGPNSIDPSSFTTPEQNYVYLASLLGQPSTKATSSSKGK